MGQADTLALLHSMHNSSFSSCSLFFVLYKDESLTYEHRSEKHREVDMKRQQLQLMERKYPISCSICGDRMENLVWNPIQHQWLCVPCYNYAHENFPKVYP